MAMAKAGFGDVAKKKKEPPTVVIDITLPKHSDRMDPLSMVFDFGALWEKKTGLPWETDESKTEDQRQMEKMAADLEKKYGKDQVYGKGKKRNPQQLFEELDLAGMGYDKDDPFIDDSEVPWLTSVHLFELLINVALCRRQRRRSRRTCGRRGRATTSTTGRSSSSQSPTTRTR